MSTRYSFLSLLILVGAIVISTAAFAQDDAKPVCGENAVFNEEYGGCFCKDGFTASKNGTKCVEDVQEKPQTTFEIETLPAEPEETVEPEKTEEIPAIPPEPEKEKPEVIRYSAETQMHVSDAPEKKDSPAGKLLLQRGTIVRIKLSEDVHSQYNQSGDIIHFYTIGDVRVNDTVVIPEGSEALGWISYLRPAKGWGRSGKIEISINVVKAIDGTNVPLGAEMEKKEDWAAGKTLAGPVIGAPLILGPIGFTFGGGVKGKKVVITKGTIVEVFVAEDIAIDPSGKKEKDTGTSVESTTTHNEVTDRNADPGKKVCFDTCKTYKSEEFVNCMSSCEDCLEVCDGLTGKDFSECLGMCTSN